MQLSWTAPDGTTAVLPGTAVAPDDASDLPSGWMRHQLGDTPAGVITVPSLSGTWTVHDEGGDLWGTGDQGTLLSRALTGDVSITAQVHSLGGSDQWAKAGVVLRVGSADGDPYAATCVTVGNGVVFLRRATAGGVTSHTAGPGTPTWVRLERSGTAVISSCSLDGTTWREVRRATIALGSAIQVGVIVSARDHAPCTATFQHVSIIAATAAAN